MIVCSCNVISCHDVRRVCGDGPDCARRVAEVYTCLGCSAQCGRCARTVLTILREALDTAAVARDDAAGQSVALPDDLDGHDGACRCGGACSCTRAGREERDLPERGDALTVASVEAR
jgi:bacterioferritin-associated ferredoxin